jgi:hypothetical protein
MYGAIFEKRRVLGIASGELLSCGRVLVEEGGLELGAVLFDDMHVLDGAESLRGAGWAKFTCKRDQRVYSVNNNLREIGKERDMAKGKEKKLKELDPMDTVNNLELEKFVERFAPEGLVSSFLPESYSTVFHTSASIALSLTAHGIHL